MVSIITLQDTEISQDFYIYPITTLVDRQENIFLRTELTRKTVKQKNNTGAELVR